MPNILAPFGFRHMGYMEGHPPTMGITRRKIAAGYTTPIFRNDPIVSTASGYLQLATTNAVQIAGIFHSCEYYSQSQQGRKIFSRFWPGNDAVSDADAFFIDTGDSKWVAQSNGAPITIAMVGLNVGFYVQPTTLPQTTPPAPNSGQGSIYSGYSGAMIDVAGLQAVAGGPPAANPAFAFRILGLYSDYQVPGAPVAGGSQSNGTDNTSNYNWAVLGPNNWDTKSLTGI